MSILDTLLRRNAKAFTPENVPHDASPSLAYALTIPNEYDYKRSVGEGGATSIVGAIINWELRRFPEATLQVRRRVDGEWQAQAPHDLTELIDRPNLGYPGSSLWAGFIISRLLDGNAYWLKVRNGATRVVELWYIPHFQIEPKGGRGAFIDFYEWRIGGLRYEVPPSEIWHYRRGMDAQNPRKGCSEIKEQMREIYTDEEAARFTAALLQNFGVPGLLLTPKDGGNPPDQDTADLIVAKVDQKLQGAGRGRTSFISNAVDIKTISWSPEQMNLAGIRNIPEERLTAATGIPAAVLGLGTGLEQTKVGATMAEMREMAVEDAMAPLWRDAAGQLTQGLLYEFTGGDQNYALRFDISEVRVLQEDRDKLHTRTMLAFNGGLIDSQTAERRLGYPLTEERNVYHVPIQVIEVPVGEAPVRPAPKSLGMKAAPSALGFLRLIDRARPGIERIFARDLEPALAELGRMAEQAYSASTVKALALVGKGNGRDRKVALPQDDQIADAVLQALGFEDYRDGTLRPVYTRHFSAAADMVIGAYADAFGSTLAIGVRDVAAETLIREGGRRLGLIDLQAETRAALLSALADAREAGLGIPATGRLIREYVPAGRFTSAGARYRANMIARTETRWATNMSVAEVGELAGFEQYQAYDDRTGFGDGECVARDGQVFSYDEMLSEMGAEHPQGTLSFSPVPRT